MATRVFKGRSIIAGAVTAKAVVSRQGVNTLATFQKSAMKRNATEVICGDQNNSDIYNKRIDGMALCLPKTIGSTTGGMVLYTIASIGFAPAAMLFSERIDSLAAAGVILSDVWSDNSIIAVDNLGEEFLEYVKDGMQISVSEDGTVSVDS